MNFKEHTKRFLCTIAVVLLSLTAVFASTLSKSKQTTAYVGETVTLDQTATHYTAGNNRWSLSSPLIYRSGTNTSLTSVWATQQSRSISSSGSYDYITSYLGAHSIDYNLNQINAYPSFSWTYSWANDTLY